MLQTLDDMLPLLCEEFRRIEILEPHNIHLNNKEAEKFLFKINEQLQQKIYQKQKENIR